MGRTFLPPETHSFVGITSFYCHFMRDFSKIAKTFTGLIRQIWELKNGEQKRSFERLKRSLSMDTVFQLPHFCKPFIVCTDVSNVAIGAVSQQHFGRGRQPVAHENCNLTDEEQQNSAYKRGLLAALHACHLRPHYLSSLDWKPITYRSSVFWCSRIYCTSKRVAGTFARPRHVYSARSQIKEPCGCRGWQIQAGREMRSGKSDHGRYR